MTLTTEDVLSLQGPALARLTEEFGAARDVHSLYLHFRFQYLRGNVAAMQHLLEEHTNLIEAEGSWLRELLRLRLAIRTKQALTEICARASEAFAGLTAPAWRGEAFMVLAMALEDAQNDSAAQNAYQKSAGAFRAAGMPRKSLIARYNGLASQTRIEAGKQYFFELQSFADEAISLKCFDLAGTALANLSRDCQLAGAPELALKHCAEALHYLRAHDFGTLQYFLTVAHHLNLLLQLSKWDEAVVYYEELRLSPFNETKEISTVITDYLNAKKEEPDYAHLPLTWRERRKDLLAQKSVRFTAKERQLVESLTCGPLSLGELTGRLYGAKIDFESGVARTKQLLHRLKQKAPQLIVREDDKYVLA